MNTNASRRLLVILCISLVLAFGCVSIGVAGTRANLIFESASVTIGSSMDADFDASAHRNCSSIYVSSCILQKKNSSGSWVYATALTPPSDVATNTSDFGALADYESSCTSGNTYRVYAVFKAIYDGATYTVTRISNSVHYN